MPLQMLSDMSQLQALQGALQALLQQVLLVPVLTFGVLALVCFLGEAAQQVLARPADVPRQAAAPRAVARPAASPR